MQIKKLIISYRKRVFYYLLIILATIGLYFKLWRGFVSYDSNAIASLSEPKPTLVFETGFHNDTVAVFINDSLFFAGLITSNESTELATEFMNLSLKPKENHILIKTKYSRLFRPINRHFKLIVVRKSFLGLTLVYTNRTPTYQ